MNVRSAVACRNRENTGADELKALHHSIRLDNSEAGAGFMVLSGITQESE
nr:hypothetical protein [Escherichia coli O25b:H4-ST131]